MRILVLNWLDRENPQSGGAEQHLHETFGRLAAAGHEVTALVSGWAGGAARAQLDGIDVHRTAGRYTFAIAAPRYYRRHLAARDFDVVVEDLNKVPLFSPLWVRSPVVLFVHHLFGKTAFRAASPPVAAATWVLERPVPLAYRRVPVVAVSESTREDLVARGLRRDRIDVVPNGIDLDRFTPDPSAKSAAPQLVFMGRLKEYKRVDLVIRAVALLRDRGLDVQLQIGGAGSREGPLRSLADRLGVADRVRLLGFVTEEEKVELLRRSWIHVLTSSKEGWGISNVEAAACGTPTVASDAPGLRESVRDGETGLLVPHGDVGALADALEALIRDPESRAAMALRARSFAEGLSWDASASRLDGILRRVVGAYAPE